MHFRIRIFYMHRMRCAFCNIYVCTIKICHYIQIKICNISTKYVAMCRKNYSHEWKKPYALVQSGAWGLKNPQCGPSFFKYFRHSRKNNGQAFSVTFASRLHINLKSYNHTHAPCPHMWPSQGPGHAGAPKQLKSDVHVKS